MKANVEKMQTNDNNKITNPNILHGRPCLKAKARDALKNINYEKGDEDKVFEKMQTYNNENILTINVLHGRPLF